MDPIQKGIKHNQEAMIVFARGFTGDPISFPEYGTSQKRKELAKGLHAVFNADMSAWRPVRQNEELTMAFQNQEPRVTVDEWE